MELTKEEYLVIVHRLLNLAEKAIERQGMISAPPIDPFAQPLPTVPDAPMEDDGYEEPERVPVSPFMQSVRPSNTRPAKPSQLLGGNDEEGLKSELWDEAVGDDE
jgi:hypothetical protein